jgi:hypothetical protein
MAGSTRVFPVEFRNEFRSVNVVPRFPRVMFNAVTLPFDEVAQLPVHHLGIQNLFYNPLFFAVDDLRKRRRCWATTRNGVWRSRQKLDNIKDRVQTAHRWGEFKAVCTVTDLLDYLEWAKTTMG